MQKVFEEVNSLDKRCYEDFALSEDILMEHAANSIALHIKEKFELGSSVLVVCGIGNNGADGITIARILHKDYDVKLYLASEPKTKIGKDQLKRANAVGVCMIKEVEQCDVVVDCLFGSGLNKPLSIEMTSLIEKLNKTNSYKIACDIPSGINNIGQINSTAFEANITFTMGALKYSLFSDEAKEYVGDIKVCDLGISRKLYETNSNMFLLEISDMNLPFRNKQNTHKGTFGHLNVIVGEKEGAAKLTAEAGFVFGVGLVTLVNHEKHIVKDFLMQSHFVSENCTALAIGMGLGKFNDKEIKEILAKKIPKVIDADLFYSHLILEVLEDDEASSKSAEVVLTPHPKEFVSLLSLCKIANINVEELQKNRFKYVKEFCKKYPKIVLLLKGANVLIGHNDKIYINTFGSSVLAKGGSGDVLSGLIASLLAQGYSGLDACIIGSLAHAKSLVSSNYAKTSSKNSYAFTPYDLIEGVKSL